MTTLLIDMPSGAAGDMLLAALIDLGADPEAIRAGLAGLGCGPIGVTVQRVLRSGLAAAQVTVEGSAETEDHAHPHGDGTHTHAGHDHGHPHDHSSAPGAAPVRLGAVHRPWRVIRDLLARADLPERVRERAQRVFRLLAEAEGRVHGVPADDIEFHEVGSIDAIADVVGCCLALEQLGVDTVVAGPLRPGHGQVRCAHGVMPVPVPAVAAILALTGAPSLHEASGVGELTTPTGAALVCALTTRWLGSALMPLRVERVGYGAGRRVLPGLPNVLRTSLVESVPAEDPDRRVVELRCTVDDATGEQLAWLVTALLGAGALDAWLVPVVMKKGRPGHELVVLAALADQDRLAALVLNGSTSIGLRRQVWERTVLPRRVVTVTVADQTIRVKEVVAPDGTRRAKPEADDLAAAARATGWMPAVLQVRALEAWRRGDGQTEDRSSRQHPCPQAVSPDPESP